MNAPTTTARAESAVLEQSAMVTRTPKKFSASFLAKTLTWPQAVVECGSTALVAAWGKAVSCSTWEEWASQAVLRLVVGVAWLRTFSRGR